MRKLFTYWIFGSLIFLFMFQPITAKAKSFSIEQVDIHAMILDNGDLYVEELFTYQFEGQFNGTTRTIGDDDHRGVKFFEGYLTPPNTTLLNYNSSSFKPLKVEREDLTFKIHTASKDETKRFFYRYLIEGAVTKYEDTGQFYWRFFDEINEADLHNVTIRLSLYNDLSSSLRGYAFLHDLTGGTLEKSAKYGYIYGNELLPAGKTAEIRYLFPQDFLKNASMTENTLKLETFLKEEEDYEKWFEMRSRLNPFAEGIGYVLFIIALLLLLITVFYPRRLIRLFHKGGSVTVLKKFDSFILINLYRKGHIEHSDIMSALFRMYQKGVISMQHAPARAAYLEDEEAPDHTYYFTLLKDEQNLAQYEKELINWLFVTNASDQKVFSLDQLPFPTQTEKQKNWRLEKEYKKAEKQFHQTFKKWKKIVLADPEINTFVTLNPIRKWLLKLGVPFWMLYSLLSAWMGRTDVLIIIIILMLLLGSGAVMYIKRNKRFAPFLYFLIGSIITSLSTYEISGTYIFVAGAFILIALFVPVVDVTSKGTPYYKRLKKFRKAVMNGEFTFDGIEMEKWYQHALSLDLFLWLKYRYAHQFSESVEGFSPILKNPTEDSEIFYYPYQYYHNRYHSDNSHSSDGSSGSGSSGGSGGGGGAGAF
ncbi:DUF2207 domain-containing protein [Bacillus sp. FJAT-29790]|uniref:DUF2207 domain-containing protein n=1 Tax=Bacillus sp. FJAT-29790 TaxID=1895002 RepID=UPI001C21300D|nr:DUF2207 domain-containing protein [Bacillus sp. FJAT-29790]MBU8881375.1 DUF2207 domain-containing protein [Bacillus sp. FJAT-29790]